MNTIVIFRWEPEGGVFALFPELPADNRGWFCTCYQHIGQHGSADYALCVAHSRPAKPDEYAHLRDELERRGYILAIHQRATAMMHERRQLSAHLRPRAKATR
jgi:hypothetical protein